MKKFYFMAMAAAMFGMASCSNDDQPVNGGAEGEMVVVNYSLSLPSQMASRAYGDASTDIFGEATEVKTLHYAVYATGSTTPLFQDVCYNVFGNGDVTHQLPLSLVTGKTYDLVFWADAATTSDAGMYKFNADGQTIEVDYTSMANFTETADGFFGQVIGMKVTGAMSRDVELRRPFAQLNIGTDDVALTNPAVKAVSVTVPVYSEFNLLTGAVIGSAANVTFGPTDFTSIKAAFPVAHADNTKTYQYLAMDYLLVNQRELVTVTMQTDDATADPRVYNNVPVQRNYRTNIYGSLLTSSVAFNIKIEKDFNEPDNNIYISTPAQFSAALNAGGDYVLVNDINLTSDVVASAPVNIDLNDNNLNLGTNSFGVYNEVPVTITDGTINSSINQIVAGVFNVGDDAKPNEEGVLKLSNVTLNATGSAGICMHGKTKLVLENTTINAGSYCIATNASTPLVQTLDITINGGKFTGFSPIFVNVPCKLKMTDAEVNGSMHGVVVRGGTVEINGGKIYMTYDESESESDADLMANYFASRNWGTGNTINLAALVMGNKVAETSTSYRYPTNVTLNGVEVACKGTYASKFPTVYIWPNPADGQGVTFVYDTNCTFTGGTGIVVGKTENVTINGVAPTHTGVQ